MSEAGRKSGNGFKKRAHRPWKAGLLESTVQEASVAEADDDLFSFDIDLDLDTSADSSSFYPEFNFLEDARDIKLDLDNAFEEDDLDNEIKQEIKQNRQQQKQLVQQLSDKSGNSILLGGFFQPQQISANNETSTGRKINSLLTDLKARELKISSLTNNLKITEAYERAEQAELSKNAATHQLQKAENRMRQAVEQAKLAEDQFLTAMDQAKQAAMAHQEEAHLRREAENQAKEARLRANNAEIELQNERLARIAADEKAQHAMVLAEKASLFQRQLADVSEKLVQLQNSKATDDTRRAEVQEKYDALNKQFFELEQEHKECSLNMQRLEAQIKELTEKYQTNEKTALEFNSQRDKLKAIIAAEQDLRKAADRKYQEALARAEKAEQGWQVETQQRKLIEQRAKRAVANASRTVINLLNTPGDADIFQASAAEAAALNSQAKAKIKVPAISDEFDYEEDDLLF